MITQRNFATLEQQPLAVTGTAAGGSFSTSQGQNANSVKITNYGSAGAQVAFGATAPTALATASAAATKQCYIAAGSVQVVEKGSGAIFFSAITDASTTSLILEAGEGA